jgi:hypothetical protein
MSWQDILKDDSSIIELEDKTKIRLVLSSHFKERLQQRFPDIKIKRIVRAIKRNLDRNAIRIKEKRAIKLMRQSKQLKNVGENPKRASSYNYIQEPTAYVIVFRPTLKTIVVKTITSLSEQRAKKYSLLEEN